jgi:hypothetical protein
MAIEFEGLLFQQLAQVPYPPRFARQRVTLLECS